VLQRGKDFLVLPFDCVVLGGGFVCLVCLCFGCWDFFLRLRILPPRPFARCLGRLWSFSSRPASPEPVYFSFCKTALGPLQRIDPSGRSPSPSHDFHVFLHPCSVIPGTGCSFYDLTYFFLSIALRRPTLLLPTVCAFGPPPTPFFLIREKKALFKIIIVVSQIFTSSLFIFLPVSCPRGTRKSRCFLYWCSTLTLCVYSRGN